MLMHLAIKIIFFKFFSTPNGLFVSGSPAHFRFLVFIKYCTFPPQIWHRFYHINYMKVNVNVR
jgi:hypothetical protein